MHDSSIKQQLIEINRELAGLVDAARDTLPAHTADKLRDWRETCEICEKRLEDDLLRMAVVGTIKSGKSTFINSLFSGDYLKRGAGVITSIVTKVRRSNNRLRAVLYFKSWEEINSEISQALQIFPSTGWRSAQDPFNIRNPRDRSELERALKTLESKHLLSKNTRNINSVLLSAYLHGYAAVETIVSDRTETVIFENDDFHEQKAFSGSESLAVFLKDIHIEIPAGDIEENIEIADCQGSDSPNPLHLVMIQEYLRSADLIVYLISSRTGLRQADIRFLTIIRNMVGMSHVLFVINSDFNEHESLADLKRVAEKAGEDLSLIVKDPAIYVFSALYSLFFAQRVRLSEKDRGRLDQWMADDSLVAYSEGEKYRFKRDFRRLLTENRHTLLLRNQVQRMRILLSDFRHWLDLNREILTSDAAGADTLLKKIRQQQKKTERIRAMIKSTLDGATAQLKKEIRSQVDRFFDIRHGVIGPGVVEFVKNYSIAYESYQAQLVEIGFSDTLFSVFQTFKQDLDRYMAEHVNPALIHYIRESENEIGDHFESIARPFEAMIAETLSAHGISENAGRPDGAMRIELESLKESRGLSVPPASATLAYTTALKTEAFMRLGFYRIIQAVRKAFKRGERDDIAELPALKSGVSRMKRETEASLNFHFKNFKENVKFQYLFKLIDGVSDEMNTLLVNRFTSYQTELSDIKALAGQNQEIKTTILDAIADLQGALSIIANRIGELEGRLHQR